MKVIDVGIEFYHRLANRDEHQGDGKYSGVDFRQKYLSEIDNPEAWRISEEFIVLDFKNVKKIGPSFANSAFGHFMQFTNPDTFLKRVRFINISDVHKMIIKEELESAFSGK